MKPSNPEKRISPRSRRATSWLVLGALVLIPVTMAQAKTVPIPVAMAQAKIVVIPIEGMSCLACAGRVKKTLSSIDGVGKVAVSLEHSNAQVQYVEGKVSPQRLSAAISALGYKAGTPIFRRTK